MERYNDNVEKEQAVRLWLKKRSIPFERYQTLHGYDKEILRNQICGIRAASPSQLKKLYMEMCLLGGTIGGRDYVDPTDLLPHGELLKFFAPLTPSEKLPETYKY